MQTLPQRQAYIHFWMDLGSEQGPQNHVVAGEKDDKASLLLESESQESEVVFWLLVCKRQGCPQWKLSLI